MTYGLLLRPEAEIDVADAADWYGRQRSGLSLEFREALDKTLLRSQIIPGYIRRCTDP